MSANTNLVTSIQNEIADELLPALKVAEQTALVVAGENIEIPQQVQARLKQKVNQAIVSIRTKLNQISV